MLPPDTIDVHAHFLPPVYRDALRSAGLTLLDGGVPVPEWSPELALGLMDQIGVRAAILSVSSPFVGFVAPGDAPALCRAVNDYAADLRERHPDRFGAYAMLPVPDVEASLAEIVRAIDGMAFDGVALPTNAAGIYLGDPKFAPILDALEERETTVFVHPTSPCCFEAFGLGLPAPMFEFPFDTTRAVASLLFSGKLAKRQRINFIFSHAGGTVPFLAQRITRFGSMPVLGDRAVPYEESIAALARFHYDIALAGTPAQVDALRTIAPIERILYGTDYPFAHPMIVAAAAMGFDVLGFDDSEREAIAVGNAARLFPGVAARCCGCAH